MSWQVPFPEGRIALQTPERISPKDAQRQARTAAEILNRLARQPGLVLADEVGMGKTFVALAVATSVIWKQGAGKPVVVMVPPRLQEKWESDFEIFRQACLVDEPDRKIRSAKASSGIEFFKLLDDAPSRRAHIIFVTHGAFHRNLGDPWTKLAILQHALRPSRFQEKRRALPRFAARILRLESRFPDPALFEDLLSFKTRDWREILKEAGKDPGDDPVPAHIAKVIEKNKVDLKELREALWDLPERTSDQIQDRLKEIRRTLALSLQGIWEEALIEVRFTSPLLILDEAHHLKNPATRLASLFVEEEAEEDSQVLQGALAHRFDRMLFLTATPFQLGHHELLNVLGRFEGIRWPKNHPHLTVEGFRSQMQVLGKTLDDAQLNASLLDQRWKWVTPELVGGEGSDQELNVWWGKVLQAPEEQPEKIQMILRAFQDTAARMRRAEEVLGPWVIRHLRERVFPDTEVARRQIMNGAAIEEEEGDGQGLRIQQDSLLPFLLAACCEAFGGGKAANGGEGVRRATFAEGLASSYEAFCQTRSAALGQEEGSSVLDEDFRTAGAAASRDPRLSWYIEKLHEALPHERAFAGHPKVQATARRVLQLWQLGEKVLVFCHYRATGKALAKHISRALEDFIFRRVAEAENIPRGEVHSYLENFGRRFGPDRPLTRVLEREVEEILEAYPQLTMDERKDIHEVIRRFVRTPSFLVRYYPPGTAEDAEEFRSALRQPDASGQSLHDKLAGFAHFIGRRCQPKERGDYLQALESIQTGSAWYADTGEEEEQKRARLFAPVRLATGAVKEEQRQTLLRGFNTPFFPEVLIASSVLAEGVDLQLNCRFVIHHDLSWNPCTLEQRTGRVDRIGAKAEQVRKPIHIYFPFIAETQDEKMFRVVRDRDRWFQVLLGEKFEPEEAEANAIERRVPLPPLAARDLTFRLAVSDSI